jgi:hypothetical protein
MVYLPGDILRRVKQVAALKAGMMWMMSDYRGMSSCSSSAGRLDVGWRSGKEAWKSDMIHVTYTFPVPHGPFNAFNAISSFML